MRTLKDLGKSPTDYYKRLHSIRFGAFFIPYFPVRQVRHKVGNFKQGVYYDWCFH